MNLIDIAGDCAGGNLVELVQNCSVSLLSSERVDAICRLPTCLSAGHHAVFPAAVHRPLPTSVPRRETGRVYCTYALCVAGNVRQLNADLSRTGTLDGYGCITNICYRTI